MWTWAGVERLDRVPARGGVGPSVANLRAVNANQTTNSSGEPDRDERDQRAPVRRDEDRRDTEEGVDDRSAGSGDGEGTIAPGALLAVAGVEDVRP